MTLGEGRQTPLQQLPQSASLVQCSLHGQVHGHSHPQRGVSPVKKKYYVLLCAGNFCLVPSGQSTQADCYNTHTHILVKGLLINWSGVPLRTVNCIGDNYCPCMITSMQITAIRFPPLVHAWRVIVSMNYLNHNLIASKSLPSP